MSSTRSLFRVLVVDDDKTMLLFLAGTIELLGYQVVTANSAEEALDIIRRENINMVITDMYMTGESGIDLLKSTKQIKNQLPIVLMTGKPTVEAAVECLKLGAVDYLSKPIGIDTIKAAIDNVWSRLNTPEKMTGREKTIMMDPDGRVLGAYKLIRTVGEGAMGIVFLVERNMDGVVHPFAMKLLRCAWMTEMDRDVLLERFLHEIRAASQISHPNIVRVVEFGIAQQERIPYMVMEFVDGQSLVQIVEHYADYTYTQKAQLLRQVAAGLSAIHDRQIAHRDIKPSNILVDKELNVKLTDFGLARLPDSNLTMSQSIMGTPHYLAPESFLSARVDARADLFSLGIVAYELFTGKRPFAGNYLPQLEYEIRACAPVAPRKLLPDFPKPLERIIGKLLRKSVDDRYQSAAAALADLDAYLEGRSSENSENAALGRDDWK